MTNADVPTLAASGVIDNPINPFTGKAISGGEKTAHPQVVTSSGHWDVKTSNGTTFGTSDGRWHSAHDDIFKEGNWEPVEWGGQPLGTGNSVRYNAMARRDARRPLR